MKRRRFLKIGTGFFFVAAVPFCGGCVAPLVGSSALDPQQGSPWRCSNCGHLTRSSEDLTDTRCPRCYQKRFEPVSEEEFALYLEKANENEKKK